MLDRLLHRSRPLRGGIFLPDFGTPASGAPMPFAIPSVLTVALQQHDGPPAVAEVQAGQQLEAAQRIGRADASGAIDVHTPAAGTVMEFVRIDSARRTDIPAVRIRTSQAKTRASAPQPKEPLPQASLRAHRSPPELEEIIAAARLAGLTDFQPRANSLALLLTEASRSPVAHLIINTLCGEPMTEAGMSGLHDHSDTLVRITNWIAAAVGAEHISIAADRADGQTLRGLRTAVRGSRIRIAGLINKYPQHAPVLLACSVAGIETPPGESTLKAGVLVLQAEALMHLAEALSLPGEQPFPLTHRIVAVAGPAVVRPGLYRIPIGTSFAEILRQVGLRHTPKRVIEGGPVTGMAVAHLEVMTTKQTSALLVLDRASDHVPAPGPCVRCGWCQEDCPVGLDPQMLLNLAEKGDYTAAATYFPQACIECGVCSFVCPAELPLAQAAAHLVKEGGMRRRENESPLLPPSSFPPSSSYWSVLS